MSYDDLIESNKLYFWGLSTQVIKFFNGALYGTNIVLIIVTMVIIEQFKGFLLLDDVLMSANACTFAFILLCKIHVFCIGKGKMEVFQLTSTAKLRPIK